MPHMRWHPETGESQIFKDGEAAPEGWLDYHPDDTEKAPKPEPETVKSPKPPKPPADENPDKPLTKKELTDALTQGGIEFEKDAKVEDLNALLSDALRAALTAANVSYPADASTRALLALVVRKP